MDTTKAKFTTGTFGQVGTVSYVCKKFFDKTSGRCKVECPWASCCEKSNAPYEERNVCIKITQYTKAEDLFDMFLAVCESLPEMSLSGITQEQIDAIRYHVGTVEGASGKRGKWYTELLERQTFERMAAEKKLGENPPANDTCDECCGGCCKLG